MFINILGQVSAAILIYRTIVFVWIYFLKPSKISKYATSVDGKQPYAIVTGASDGIGLETARALLAKGFNLILHGRNPTKLTNITNQLQKDFPEQKTEFVVADATDAFSSASHVASQVHDLMRKNNGRLSVLVNNVGGNIGFNSRAFHSVSEGPDDSILRITSLNALFPHTLTRLILPTLLDNGSPSLIIFVGSLAGQTGMPYIAAYSSSKAANHAFATALSEEMTCIGSNVEVLGVIAGNVVSAGNTFTSPGFGTIDSQRMAEDILARVGCGVPCVVGNWRQALQGESLNYVPDWLSFLIKRKVMSDFREVEEKRL